MITGGEVADPADCQAALGAAPWARLLNAYGLTEATITSAIFDVSGWRPAEPWSAVPVGRPAGPARLMVLDGKLKPVPPGTSGEVYIGGPGVGRGYLGRPGLTAERFLPDPAAAPGSRMYRTGDLGRWLEAGRLEIAGRMDRQLKVRGYRIEPGEIESVLAGHPDIDEVSVVATSRHAGDSHLVAYYTPTRAAAQTALHHPRAASLRRYLLRPAAQLHDPGGLHRPSPQVCPGGQAQHGSQHNQGAGRTRPVPGQRRRGSGAQLTPTEAGLSALWGRLLSRDVSALTMSSSRSAATPCSPRRCWCAPTPSSASRPTRCARLPAACSAIQRCGGSPRRGGGRPRGAPSTDGDPAEVDFGRETG